jgi:cell wall-associated NlpC family hydrolase
MLRHALRVLVLAGVLANLVGCGLFGPRETPEALPEAAPTSSTAPQPEPPVSDDTALLRGHLYEHYKLWKGTPYRMGGLTTHGIDCSGFVLVTFKALMDTRLPRTVDEQATLGRGIGPSELRTGDLVFFKTGSAMRHVGIYLDHGRFMHASTRRGVMISALADGYWRQRFWQARRIRESLVAREEHGDDTPAPRP